MPWTVDYPGGADGMSNCDEEFRRYQIEHDLLAQVEEYRRLIGDAYFSRHPQALPTSPEWMGWSLLAGVVSEREQQMSVWGIRPEDVAKMSDDQLEATINGHFASRRVEEENDKKRTREIETRTRNQLTAGDDATALKE